MLRLILLALVLFTFEACGGSSDSSSNGGGAATCESALTRVCQRACDCGAGTCRFASVSDSGATASFSWKTLDECKSFMLTLGCASGSGVDGPACSSAIESATCVSASDGPAIELPKACSGNHPDGG